jgi:peptidyl-prolyl cis-trans isomerase D
MLQILNDKLKGIFASIILFLIIASFAFVGLNQLFFSPNTDVAATVDGHNIDWKTVMMFAERIERERGLPVSAQSLEEVRYSLVQTQALANGLKKAGFYISEAQVAKALATIPVFQDETGKFSKTRYLTVLKNHGYQDVAFRQELAQNLLLSQVEQGILLSNFWLPYEFTQSIQLLLEKRDIGYAVLPKKIFAEKVATDNASLQTFYETHKTQYIRPETVSLQYVELRLSQVIDEIKASNLELKNFYLENQGFYNTPEMRHARHILFATEGRDQADQAKQLAAAEKTLAALKTGGNFEELAKKYSDDAETREHGGDMGWVGKGDLDVSFEEALFSLKSPQELSPIIKSADGYHIIQLLEHKLASIQSFEAVKDVVNEQYRRQKAQQLFEEKKEQLAALAFEYPESLDKIKQIMNLSVFETAPFDREGHGAEKWSQYPEFLQVAFSPLILSEKRNSEVINITPERALVVRVNHHALAEQQTFEAVADRVKADYVQQMSAQNSKAAAEKIVADIRAGESPEKALKPYSVTWKQKTDVSRRDQTMDRWIVDKAFMLGRAPLLAEPPKPVVDAFLLPSSDYGILSINKVMLGKVSEADAKTKSMAEKNVIESWTRAEYGLWAHHLISKANIRLMPIPATFQQIPE